jgi:hypothetical protein
MQNMDGRTGAIMATLVLAGVSPAAEGRDFAADGPDGLIRERPRVVPEIMELFARARAARKRRSAQSMRRH